MKNLSKMELDVNAVIKVYDTLVSSVGYYNNTKDRGVFDVFVDQDGHSHLIFMDSEEQKNEVKRVMHGVYNTVYGSGECCLVRSRLVNTKLRYTFNEKVPNGITIITIASILRKFAYCDNMELMSQLTFWIHS